MTSQHGPVISTLSISAANQIDAVCDDFEAALQAGKADQLEHRLAMIEESLQPVLLHQLLLVSWDHSHRCGRNLDLSKYLSRFPNYAAVIEAAYAEFGRELTAFERIGDSANGSSASAVGIMRDWEAKGYVMLEQIGRGGMASVFLARKMATGRLVALKVLSRDFDRDTVMLGRFRQEIQILSRLQNPNIVPVIEVGTYDGRPFYSMEYCSGGSLADYLRFRRLTAYEAADLIETIAKAVHATHQMQIIHRDLKPSNILLQQTGQEQEAAFGCGEPECEAADQEMAAVSASLSSGTLIPKVSDFGLAKELNSATHTSTGAVLGTPQYMSPEQARGETSAIGVATDIHAIGAIFYECLTGRTPFKGATLVDTVRQVISNDPTPPTWLDSTVPHDLETICLNCLHKEPHARYPDAAMLVEELRRFRCGEAIQARPVGAVERARKWARRHPAVAALFCVLVLSGSIGLALAVWALEERDTAVTARNDMESALIIASQQKSRADQQTALMLYTHALDAGERAGPEEAMLWLSRGLQVAIDSGAEDIEESIRVQLGAWYRDLQPVRITFIHDSEIMSAALSQDGTTMVSGTKDDSARVWDVASGSEVCPPLQHADTVFAVAFSPDGSKVVTGSGDGTAQIWETATGNPLGPPLEHDDRVLAVAFSPDGQSVLTGSHDTTARLWETATGMVVGASLEHQDIVRCVAFSPDGNTIVTGGDDGVARLWEATTLRPLEQALKHGDSIFSAVFSPDGKMLVTGGADGTARLWDTTTEAPGPVLQHPGRVMAVDVSPDGTTVLTASWDRSVRLWDTNTGRSLATSLRHADQVRTAAFSADGESIVTGCYDGAVRLWDVSLPTTLAHSSHVRASAFSADSRTVITVHGTGTVHHWDTITGDPLRRPVQHRLVWSPIIDLSPDGGTLLAGGNGESLQLSSTASDEPTMRTLEHTEQVTTTVFSPDGSYVLTNGSNAPTRIWDITTGQLLDRSFHDQQPTSFLDCSPDSQSIVTVSSSGVELWNVNAGERLLLEMPERTNTAVMSPNGQSFVSVSIDNTTHLWEVSRREHRSVPRHLARTIRTISFSPDSKLFLTTSDDHIAQLWQTSDCRRCGQPFELPARIYHAAAFSPDGRWLLIGCWGGRAQLWRINTRVEGSPRQIRCWAELTTGMELDQHGRVRWLDAAAWSQREQELKLLGGPPIP